MYETCDNCDGTGNDSEYDAYYHRCHRCNGKGYINNDIHSVPLPPGDEHTVHGS